MFIDINSIIPKALKRAGLTGAMCEAGTFEEFTKEARRILKGEEANKLKPVFLQDDILFVAAISESIVKKLEDKKGLIIKNINNSNCQCEIKDIQYLT